MGRFQPVHKGHVNLIQRALEDCPELLVGIGSSNARPSLRNPFTVQERRAMLTACFPDDVKQGRLRLVDIPDIHDPPRWVAHVLALTGPLDRVYGNDDDTLDLFEVANLRVERPGLLERERYEAKLIRAQLAEDDLAWRKAVPAPVVGLLQQWDAGRRLRGLEALA